MYIWRDELYQKLSISSFAFCAWCLDINIIIFNSTENKPQKKKSVPKQLFKEPPSPAISKMQIYSKMPPPQKTHRRTHSDLNESHHATQKWHKYEQMKKTEKIAEEKAESKCQLASLGLEKYGKMLSVEELRVLKQDVDEVQYFFSSFKHTNA